MANVDSKLANAPATDGTVDDRKSEKPKIGLRGAAGGVYIGPINDKSAIEGPTSPTHAKGDEDSATARGAGGAEDSSGYRTSDTYGIDGANSGGVGGADTSVSGPSRATAIAAGGARVQPTYYRGAGAGWVQVLSKVGTVDASDSFKLTYKGRDTVTFVAGGSGSTDMVASAIQSALRTLCEDPFLTVTGDDDFGTSYIVTFSKPPGGGLSITEVVDANSDLALSASRPKGSHKSYGNEAGFALGSSGRGTNVDGSTVDVSAAGSGTAIPRPVIEDSDAPAEGVVGIINGTAKFTIDMHANDVTNFAGVEVLVFARGNPNTDEDGAFIGAKRFDSATEGDGLTTANVPALVAGTYAVYARFIDNAGNVGPMSARGTVTIS